MAPRTRAERQSVADAANRCRRDGCHRSQQTNHYCEQHAIWIAKKAEYNRLLNAGDHEKATAMSAGLHAYDAPCDCADCLKSIDPWEWKEEDE